MADGALVVDWIPETDVITYVVTDPGTLVGKSGLKKGDAFTIDISKNILIKADFFSDLFFKNLAEKKQAFPDGMVDMNVQFEGEKGIIQKVGPMPVSIQFSPTFGTYTLSLNQPLSIQDDKNPVSVSGVEFYHSYGAKTTIQKDIVFTRQQ